MARESSLEQRGDDLMVLVADGNMKAAVEGLLSRPAALGISEVAFSVVPHPERDPGCFLRAPEFLQPFRPRFTHALVMLDHEGSGRERMTRQAMEQDLEKRLRKSWGKTAAALVIEPELEAWWWSDSPHVATVLGWREPSLRKWLATEGYLAEGAAKPVRPKRAVEEALRIARRPRSSSLYRQLAEQVSVRRCEDRTFQRFRRILRRWFQSESPPLC